MKKFLLGATTIATLSISSLIALTIPNAWAERTPEVVLVDNEAYKTECGSCHMAYSPGLLPSQSWYKVMANLAQHFGENAELEPALVQQLTDYLTAQAADKSDYRRSQKIMSSLKGEQVVERITDTPYFIREHHEIPPRLFKDNPAVASLSQCNACHAKAEQGSFNEDEVRIPGANGWDD